VIVAAAAVAILVRSGPLIAGGGRGPIDALWSLPDGLFATSPAIYLAAIGLIPLWRRDRRLGLAAMGVFVVALVGTAGSTSRGPGGYFDVMVPLLVCGMAAMLEAVARVAARRPALIATAALALLVLWNVTLAGVTRAGGHRIGEPVSFGDLAAAQAATLHDWVGHPPSFPANLAYGIRHGVPPGRYDVLRPGRFFADAARASERIDVGARDDIFLQDGWHAAERAGAVTFRWSQRQSRLIVPLDRADTLRVAVRLRAFGYPGSPAQSMALTINGRALPPVTIEPDWHDVQWDIASDYWHSGLNHLALRFVYERRPSEVTGGGDNRLLAAAVDGIYFLKSR
jgi:hypothetical protein